MHCLRIRGCIASFWCTYAHVICEYSPSHSSADVKFMLLHDQRIDETATKSFFSEAYEAYVKAIMNPFHEPNSSLATPSFEEKIKTVAKKYFPR